MKKYILIIVILLFVVLCAFCVLGKNDMDSGKDQSSIFDWRYKEDTEESINNVKRVSEELEIHRIYKYFSKSQLKDRLAVSYIQQAGKAGFEVWVLDGEPQWGLEKERKDLLSFIDLVNSCNLDSKSPYKAAGVVLDIEVYSLEDWEERADDIWQQYLSNMREAYKRASQYGLKIVICIPYWLDDKGYGYVIEELAKECCDELLVMNYRCGKEWEGIENELRIAQANDIAIASAFEFGKIGTADLTKNNTYADKGTRSAFESWNKLKKYTEYDKFYSSWHSLNSIIECMDNQ